MIVSVYEVTSIRTKKIHDITLNILYEIYDEANSFVSSALSKHKKTANFLVKAADFVHLLHVSTDVFFQVTRNNIKRLFYFIFFSAKYASWAYFVAELTHSRIWLDGLSVQRHKAEYCLFEVI